MNLNQNGLWLFVLSLTVGACGESPTERTQASDGGSTSASTAASAGGTRARSGSAPVGGASSTGGTFASGGATTSGGTFAGSSSGTAVSSTRIGEALANYIIATWPNYNSVTSKNWEYTNGIVYYGITKIYEKTLNTKYLDYVKTFVDGYISPSGSISYASGLSTRDPRILDVIQPSNLLFTLYETTKDARYLTAMTSTRNVFPTIQKNSLGGFYHKPTYPYEMWLDGIYMAEPFIVRYASLYSLGVDGTGSDQGDCYATATFQIKLLAQQLMDRQNADVVLRLPVHAWADLAGLSAAGTAAPAWANTSTGRSPVLWSRALGWWAIGLVDVLQYLPSSHGDRAALTGIFADVAAGLKATQDPVTGLWHQVIDQGSLTDNWLETSASALFVYALKRGIKQGLIGSEYDAIANAGWEGVKAQVVISANAVTVKGAVGGMGVSSSYAAYVAARTGIADNVPHGLAAVLYAASEAEY